MPINIKSEGANLKIGNNQVPWWEWKTIHFELARPFDPGHVEVEGMEHRFIVKAGSAWGTGQIEIEIRCDDAKEWTALDSIAWSPDSTVDTKYLPKAYAERIRYLIFCDIAQAEHEMILAYTAAGMRVLDEGATSEYHPFVRERNHIMAALRQLRDQFGSATIDRRIMAEIRMLGKALAPDEIIAEVMSQPGVGPSTGEAILGELEKANSANPEGCLLNVGSDDDPRYGLVAAPFSEVARRAEAKSNDNARALAAEQVLMETARLATEARKAREAAEGYVAPTDLLPVVWSDGWDGYRSAKCGTDPLVVTGQINRSTTGSGAWSVMVGNSHRTREIAEDEEAAMYALEMKLRAETARMIAAAAPKPAIELNIALVEAPPS